MAILGSGGMLRLSDAYVCDVEAWELQIGANSIDITTLGQTYAEAIKDLITGGGTLNFFVEWRKDDEGIPIIDSVDLMELVQLTKVGSEVGMVLYLISERMEGACVQNGSLYYAFQALITNISLSTRATDLIRGAAEFVTTGPIQLTKDEP